MSQQTNKDEDADLSHLVYRPVVIASEPAKLALQVESVSVRPLPVRQGHTSEIEARVPGTDAPLGSLGEWTLGFQALEPGRWVALQGVHTLADPGTMRATFKELTRHAVLE